MVDPSQLYPPGGPRLPNPGGAASYVGPVRAIDDAVRWAWISLVASAAAGALAWFAFGDDDLGVTRSWALVAAGVAAALAALALVPLLAATVRTARQARGSEPRRPGTARAVAAAVVAVAALAGVGVLVVPAATDAVDQQDALDAVSAAKQDEAAAALAADRKDREASKTLEEDLEAKYGATLVTAEAGTCATWPAGPTVADRLQNAADGYAVLEISCTEPHGYEVIGTVGVGGGDGYPGASVLLDAAVGPCQQLLLDYLTPKGGTRPGATAWGAYGVAPDATRWANPGSRRVTCVAMPPRFDVERTGSLAGAG